MKPMIYVSTYGKYNNGSIGGAWLDLENYNSFDEFMNEARKLHVDEEDPEFMFQDWQRIPDSFICESSLDEDFWDFMDHPADYNAKAAYMECFGEWDGEEFDDRYRGYYGHAFNPWEEMAHELVENTGLLDDVPEEVARYFDMEMYAHDLQLGGDFCEEDGFFFWNH